MSSQTLIPGAGAGSMLEAVLLSDARSVRIGAIHRIDYHEAIVLTHDRWKHDAGGLPQFSFLLATARDVTAAGFDDDEVLLLRVEGTAPLALESDLLAVREESLRNALSETNDPKPSVVLDMDLDPFTKNRVSYTGLRCKILGTFYEDHIDGQKVLEFGSDVDNFYATSTYRVLKPIKEGLSAIASYLKPAPGTPLELVRIGTVRYSSTRRRAKASGEANAPIQVNVHDFIGHKTGMFGMTRMGKSNTMKTVVARTQVVSQRRVNTGERPVGQLIIDPQGEYANPNVQDGTEIAAIGARHVVIYKFGGEAGASNVRPLGINFFDPAQLDAVKGMIAASLVGGSADYVRAFVNADLAGDPLSDESPGEAAQRRARAERGRLMLYGALAKADFPIPRQDAKTPSMPYRVWVTMKVEVADAILADIPNSLAKARHGKSAGVNRDMIVPVCDWLAEKTESGIPLAYPSDATKQRAFKEGLESVLSGDPFKSTLPIFTQISGNKPVSGYTKLKPLKPFHAATATSDFRDDIYEELVQGRIVIVDLHLGPQSVTRQLSEDLAAHLIEKQTEVFTGGTDAPPDVQVVLEEAHNLFGKERYKDDYDVWVRLAKEASKLNIGLIYATQEVSGVAHQVLANTKNWVVAHLNNTTELRELGKFYDFSEFADAIIASEDRGYVRLKTMSSPYIVPVQIDRYGIDLVNEARTAAGDPPLTSSPNGSQPATGRPARPPWSRPAVPPASADRSAFSMSLPVPNGDDTDGRLL